MAENIPTLYVSVRWWLRPSIKIIYLFSRPLETVSSNAAICFRESVGNFIARYGFKKEYR